MLTKTLIEKDWTQRIDQIASELAKVTIETTEKDSMQRRVAIPLNPAEPKGPGYLFTRAP